MSLGPSRRARFVGMSSTQTCNPCRPSFAPARANSPPCPGHHSPPQQRGRLSERNPTFPPLSPRRFPQSSNTLSTAPRSSSVGLAPLAVRPRSSLVQSIPLELSVRLRRLFGDLVHHGHRLRRARNGSLRVKSHRPT